MQKDEILELLRKHSALSRLERVTLHWVPPGQSLDWYLGFLQSLEVHQGIQKLFVEEAREEAYLLLERRIQAALEAYTTELDSRS